MRATLLAVPMLLLPHAATAQTCPAVLDNATRLAVVTADSMNTSAARLVLYSRDNKAARWRQQSQPRPVRLGKHGLAWGAGFSHVARRGEPAKHERDGRTPAGIYRIGASFGFAASKRANYVRLKAGETFCVDDVKSPAYNTITTVARAGRVTGERMRNFPRYRQGLFLDYPSTYSRPAGSCIFIHVWSASGGATTGCVAMPEARVVELQNFAQPGAVIVVLPRPALERFKRCLPQDGAR
jgi:L,D-peptidoglycan transpeptidase YkuD (ErfK/YbiS/YcfS/YnhG family)